MSGDAPFVTWTAECPSCGMDARWRKPNPFVTPHGQVQIWCAVCPDVDTHTLLEPVPLPPGPTTVVAPWVYGARNTNEGEVA